MDKQGFTLIEVVLFMAVSSVLTFVALVGLTPRLRNLRFTDGVRNLESSIQKEFSDVNAGFSTRQPGFNCTKGSYFIYFPVVSSLAGSTPGTTNECVLNGKLAVFNVTSVTYYSIVSLRTKSSATCGTSAALDNDFKKMQNCYTPTVIKDTALSPGPVTIPYTNGLKVNSTIPASSPPQPVGIGYVQDPGKSQVYTFLYLKGSDTTGSTIMFDTANARSLDTATTFCAELDSRNAQFTFSPGSMRPTVKFDVGC